MTRERGPLRGARQEHSLLPILQVFRDYYGITEQDTTAAVREKIAGRMLLLDEGYREVLPVLFEFFGVPDPERPVPRMDPEARQRQLFGVLRRLVQGADTGAKGLVTLIEDLHWIDAASEAWLDERVDAIAGSRTSCSSTSAPSTTPPGCRSRSTTSSRWRRSARRRFASCSRTCSAATPACPGWPTAIHARTGGNPFFTEEVVQSLVESGQLAGTRGSYRLVAPVERLAVPASVQAVLAARIDRLPEREKQVLQTAAVIGKEFAEPICSRRADAAGRRAARRALRAEGARVHLRAGALPSGRVRLQAPVDAAGGARLPAAGAPASHARAVARAIAARTPRSSTSRPRSSRITGRRRARRWQRRAGTGVPPSGRAATTSRRRFGIGSACVS